MRLIVVTILISIFFISCKTDKANFLHRIDTTITINQNFHYGYKSELPLPDKFMFNNSSNIVVNPFFNSFEIVGVDTGWGYVNFWVGKDTLYAVKVKVNRTLLYDSMAKRLSHPDTVISHSDTFVHTESVLNAYSAFALINKPLPPFRLPKMEGGYVSNLDFKGIVSMINFRDSHTGIDLEKENTLSELQNKYKGKFAFYSFFADTAYVKNGQQYYASANNDSNDEKKYSHYNIDYPVAINAHSIINDFDFTTYPQTFIIDRSGVVRYILEGYNVDDKFRNCIQHKVEFLMHHE